VLELLLFILFLAGIALELFHLPMHTFVMVVALIELLVTYLIKIFDKKSSDSRTAGWLGLATISWLVFFLFEVNFFGGTLLLMAAALFVSILSLLMTLFETGALPGGRIVGLLAALALAATTSWMSPHERFYVYNIRFNDKAMTDYHTLDQYSWFLYLGQQYESALAYNKLAINYAQQNGDEVSLLFIKEHTQNIEKKSWTKFD
jgi:hypothetical protein